jgi:hypothetical protein
MLTRNKNDQGFGKTVSDQTERLEILILRHLSDDLSLFPEQRVPRPFPLFICTKQSQEVL